MDLDSPRSPESTSMEIDDDGSESTHRVQTSSSDGHHPPSGHPSFASSNAPSQSSPRFSEPGNHVGDTHRDLELAPCERRDRLLTSQPLRSEAAESRKRKIMRLSPPADHSDSTRDAHSFASVAVGSSSSFSTSGRRIRPRLLRTQLARDREFTPLLIMSPRRELLEEEETLTAVRYTSVVTDSDRSPRSIIRRHHHPLPSLDEHGPRILQSRYLPPTTDDIEAQRGRRQNSASSFEQVALASTRTSPTTPSTGSLSTLSNLSLPRPFEDGSFDAPVPPAASVSASTVVELPPSEPARGTTIIKVHERGIDAGPSFPVPSSARGGTRPSRGAAPFQLHVHFHTHQVEQGASSLLDEPLCESPISFHPGAPLSPPRIDPDEIKRVISAPTGCTQRVPVTFRSLPAT